MDTTPDTALLSEDEYLTHQSHLEDLDPKATVSSGTTVPGLDALTPPY